MSLYEIAARCNLLAHQHGECAVGFGGVSQRHLLEHTVFRIHGGFPELLGIHLTKTFVSLQNKPVALSVAFVIDKALYLLVCPAIFLYILLPFEGAFVKAAESRYKR